MIKISPKLIKAKTKSIDFLRSFIAKKILASLFHIFIILFFVTTKNKN